MTASKRHAQRFGRRAETVAALWLRLKGYRIIAKSLKAGRRTGLGEIDLIAKRGRTLAIVEVKARGALAAAADAVSHNQRRRLQRAAEAFVAHAPEHAGCDIRFDVVLVRRWARPVHIPDAWRP